MIYGEPQAGPAPLLRIVNDARHSVEIGVYYLSDRQLLQALAAARRRGVQVRLLPVKPLYMHAKMMVGEQVAFVGSENFSETSLQQNREMGVLLRQEAELSELRQQFAKDWARADR
ncbi:phospholipase D-like domain-containing protein [Igneacidithiobacillus siniensis]|uniref:phospholipase D-like domain-containing protein n=1 Tax=Acidithiobacillus TaxID=119977 RepID=UPI0020104991|nr:phospholipase D-like domain-containing protein [Acidithiobacillus sp. S30A2]